MMIDYLTTIDSAVELLNKALELDRRAISSLIQYRVPCNQAMADHPSIQVGSIPPSETVVVGLLGIINGIFGADEKGCGFIGMMDDDGIVDRFMKVHPESELMELK